jgi:hypothetical protein
MKRIRKPGTLFTWLDLQATEHLSDSHEPKTDIHPEVEI